MENFLAAFKQKPGAVVKGSKSRKNIPWIEKYRPKSIDDVAQQTEVVTLLKKCLDGKELPNLLFYGPPGTGKTSVILAMAKQLFGNLYHERVLELNASDERGINVVREKVKTFAHMAVSSGAHHGIPPYKLVVLDEADSMTAPAQAALRRTMETETRTTRFCLTCNYVTRIIDPITSRCAKFRFRPLDSVVARDRLRYIATQENLSVTDDTLDRLLQLARGDLRQGITMLQSAAQLMPSSEAGDSNDMPEVTQEQLVKIAAIIPDDLLLQMIKAAKGGSFDNVQEYVKNVLLDAHSAHQIIYQLHDWVVASKDVSDKQKAALLNSLALADSRLIDGADEYLQLLAVGGSLVQQLN